MYEAEEVQFKVQIKIIIELSNKLSKKSRDIIVYLRAISAFSMFNNRPVSLISRVVLHLIENCFYLARECNDEMKFQLPQQI